MCWPVERYPLYVSVQSYPLALTSSHMLLNGMAGAASCELSPESNPSFYTTEVCVTSRETYPQCITINVFSISIERKSS